MHRLLISDYSGTVHWMLDLDRFGTRTTLYLPPQVAVDLEQVQKRTGA